MSTREVLLGDMVEDLLDLLTHEITFSEGTLEHAESKHAEALHKYIEIMKATKSHIETQARSTWGGVLKEDLQRDTKPTEEEVPPEPAFIFQHIFSAIKENDND